jgi:hypothetical protein
MDYDSNQGLQQANGSCRGPSRRNNIAWTTAWRQNDRSSVVEDAEPWNQGCLPERETPAPDQPCPLFSSLLFHSSLFFLFFSLPPLSLSLSLRLSPPSSSSFHRLIPSIPSLPSGMAFHARFFVLFFIAACFFVIALADGKFPAIPPSSINTAPSAFRLLTPTDSESIDKRLAAGHDIEARSGGASQPSCIHRFLSCSPPCQMQ